MEMIILMVVILMSAITVTYFNEIYLYLSLVLGSLINDIKKKLIQLKLEKVDDVLLVVNTNRQSSVILGRPFDTKTLILQCFLKA
jgi:hypothetical protein